MSAMQQMSLGRVRVAQWMLVAVLAATPVFAYALGMGKLVLRSGLDEPLHGEIEITSVTPQELKTLKSTLASRADFDSAGIDRPFFLTGIKYDVTQHSDGRTYLQLTTDEPIREPFLHLLLQVEWSGGKLIREYTALLDPPQWAEAKPAEIQAPDVAASAPTPVEPPADTSTGQGMGAAGEPAPSPMPAVIAEEKKSEPVTAMPPAETPPAETAATSVAEAPPSPGLPPESQTTSTTEHLPDAMAAAPAAEVRAPGMAGESGARAWASVWEYGPVKKGETLGRIVDKLRVDKTLTPQQIMLALLRANPSAFYAKNVNNLKVGMILKVPERDDVESVPKAAARSEFQAQYEVWQKYKTQVAAASSAVTVPTESSEMPMAAVKPQEVKPQTAKPQAVKPQSIAKAAPAVKPVTPAKKEPQSSQTVGEGDEGLLKIVRSNLENTTTPEGAKAPGVETRKDAAKEQRALTEKVATLEEAIESKELQNKEMRDRVGKMQEQVKNTSRLIDLENKELAQSQKQATESAKVKPEPTAPSQPVPAASPAPAAVSAPAAVPTASPEAAQQTPPAALPAPAAAKKPVRRPVAPPPAPEPGFLQSLTDNLFDNPLLLTVLAGVGVLGAGIFAIHYVRRRRATVEFEESILSGGSIGPDNSSISESTSQPGASDTSFLSDFSQGGMGNIHTDEVDPIAEAEVYLAYGRDEQAEEILKEAVVKDPARHELKQKLLEIYHQRNDVAGFETLAEELYAALEGKGGKVWDKVEEMGRKISPNNPMFRGGAPTRVPDAAAAAVSAVPARTPANDLHVPLEREATEHAHAPDSQSLNFDLGDMQHAAPSVASTPDRAPPKDVGLDFDLGDTDIAQDARMDLEFDTETKAPTPDSSHGALDLDFNLHEEEPASAHGSGGIDFDVPAEPHVDNEISLDFDAPTGHGSSGDGGLTFSMDDTAADNPTLDFESASEATETDVAVEEPQWDETATKLDLAKAYIDMGDAEGARSILDEVLAEGNESQKGQARELAAQIR
jgi:pilus assembly protein FimV